MKGTTNSSSFSSSTSGVNENATGLFCISVIAGKGLASKDKNGFSDPFVVLGLIDSLGNFIADSTGPNNITRKTEVIFKTLNPIWQPNAWIFKINSAGSENIRGIRIEVFDKDRFGKPDFMGQIVIPVEKWVEESSKRAWLKLEHRAGKTKEFVSGEIDVKYIWLTDIAFDYTKDKDLIRANAFTTTGL